MAELKSPTNSSKALLSQEEIQKPLSPVLGTGNSLKKLYKNRKDRHKREPSKVVQKLDKVLKPKNETDNNFSKNIHDNCDVSKDYSFLKDFHKLEKPTCSQDVIEEPNKNKYLFDFTTKDLPESIVDRIQKLEEIEAKKSCVLQAISFSKPVREENLKTEYNLSNSKELSAKEQDCDKSRVVEVQKNFIKTTNNVDYVSRRDPVSIQFQTGTGKSVIISKADIKKSEKLFDDILCPTISQCSKSKKFNYLSKNKYLNCHINQDINVPNTNKFETGTLKMQTPRQNVRNIFEGENFDDLGLVKGGEFGSALRPFNKHINVIDKAEFEKMHSNTIHVVKDKEIKDLPFLQSKMFKPASTSSMTAELPCTFITEPAKCCLKTVKNIFESEDFDDLKLLQSSGFELASKAINKEIVNDLVAEHAKNLPMPHSSDFKPVSATEPQIENLKKFKPIFNSENFDDLNICKNIGFTSASSLKNINSNNNKVKESMQNKNPHLKNIFDSENFSDLNIIKDIGFQPVSKALEIKPNCVNTIEAETNILFKESVKDIEKNSFKHGFTPCVKKSFKNIFEGENFDDLSPNYKVVPSFLKSANCSGPKSTSIIKPSHYKSIFEGENFDDLNLGGLGPKFQNPISILKSKLPNNQRFKSPCQTPIKLNEKSADNDFLGFSSEEKETALKISKSESKIVNIIEDNFKEITMKQSHTHKRAHKLAFINMSTIENLSKIIYTNQNKLDLECNLTVSNRILGKKRKNFEICTDDNSLCENAGKTDSPKTPAQNSFLKRPRKRLGCHFSPTIQVSETGLKRAKLMFEDLAPKERPLETSTPIKHEKSLAQPLACDLTPIQATKENYKSRFIDARKYNERNFNLDQTLVQKNGKFGFIKPTEGDVNSWLENLSMEKQLLEEKLKMLDVRQTILANQKTILQFSAKSSKRILPGILCNAKKAKERIFLKNLSPKTQSEESSVIDPFLYQINPQNAHLVHFNMEHESQSHLQTKDCAVIVPNNKGKIGISEIEHSFKVMDGVDALLIPKGWFQNHYKWIVWKLASYERRFPDRLEGCLCVENVVQQLKYRYDIEIDQVKRSALHKIFEKDDCSQRRLVLCVSKINKVHNTYELELTDGWYSVRTVIDQPLCNQIIKERIKIGFKLMIYGAELVNCEGCHPLETIDAVFLKINYNSTRRCKWWTKLGCQRNSGPFLIPLSSLDMDGGKIGCIRCFILRVYPVKYMEKIGNQNVWRNRKAEEHREQEFYNEKMNLLEKNNSIYSKNTSQLQEIKSRIYKDIDKDIKNIQDPEILYEIMQGSSDPESLQENLSTSQKTLLYNYTLNKSAQNASGLTNTFRENARALPERSVTPLLKLKVIDASCESDVVYDFHVWRPQESHLQELKEGEVVTIFNASYNQKWGLSCNRTTQFKREQKPKDERYQKFRRKVIFIEELQCFKGNHVLNEFDTVGIVVKKTVENHQLIWLTDSTKNLLVIKIHDSPKNILVLDSLKEGQIVSVCNVVFKNYSPEHSFGVGDHFVVFSRYPQHKHLQEAIGTLETKLETIDLNSLLQDCKVKVDKIDEKWKCGSSKQDWEADDMECSQITTTDLALLECVDKLT